MPRRATSQCYSSTSEKRRKINRMKNLAQKRAGMKDFRKDMNIISPDQNLQDILEDDANCKSPEHPYGFDEKEPDKETMMKSDYEDILKIQRGLKYLRVYSIFDFENKPQKEKKVSKRPTHPCFFNGSLDYNLFRHQLFALMKKESQILPSILGVQKQLKLLRFIISHCPYQDIHNEPGNFLLGTSEIFKFTDFAQCETQDIEDAEKELREFYAWSRYFYVIEPGQDILAKSIEELLSSDNVNDYSLKNTPTNPDKKNQIAIKEELTKKIKIIKRLILEKLTPIIDSVNKKSFYYIQSRLENIFHLLKSDEDDIDTVRIKKIAEDVRNCLEWSIKHFYKYVIKESYEEVQEEWEEALSLTTLQCLIEETKSHPLEIWGELLASYQAYVDRLQTLLACNLSYRSSDEVECFIQTLLQDPFSFLKNRRSLNLNWKLVQTLLANYEKFSTDQKYTQTENFLEKTSEIPILSADLLLICYPRFLQSLGTKARSAYQKVAIPLYYNRSIKNKNKFEGLYGLNIEAKDDSEIEPKIKYEIDLMKKELFTIVVQDLKDIALQQVKELYQKELQDMEIEAMNIVIYSNDNVEIIDIPAEIQQQTKNFWETNFKDIMRKPSILDKYFGNVNSSNKENQTNVKKPEENNYKLEKIPDNENFTYFNYKYLESLLSLPYNANLSKRTYFVLDKHISEKKQSQVLIKCVSLMSIIRQNVNESVNEHQKDALPKNKLV